MVSNIPPTCMVLSSFIVGNPALGPHPIVMGADKLEWNNIDADTISLIRIAFGADPVDTKLLARVIKQK